MPYHLLGRVELPLPLPPMAVSGLRRPPRSQPFLVSLLALSGGRQSPRSHSELATPVIYQLFFDVEQD